MTDTPAIPPALSSEQWAECLAVDYATRLKYRGLQGPHADAALCLYAQPFGFTQEDVTAIMRSYPGSSADTAILRSIADRIAALLPPPA